MAGGLEAARRRPSNWRNQRLRWFQLAKIRLTTNRLPAVNNFAARNADTARRNRTASALDRSGLLGACLRGLFAMC